MAGARRRRGVSIFACLAVLAVLPAHAVPAAAETMQVQPDGKIVLSTITSPELGALGRLEPDGRPDPSFGRDGFIVDPRIPGAESIGLEPGGRIVAAAPGGLLAGYLPDGSPDPGFGADGLAGTDEPEQPHGTFSPYNYFSGPSSVIPWADGSIFVASNLERVETYGGGPVVRRYGGDGGILETAGRLGGFGVQDRLWDVEPAPGGALIGAGRGSGGSAILVRFLPGSGNEFDSSFGNGSGVVAPSFPVPLREGTSFRAVAPTEGAIFAAGSAAAPNGAYGTLLLAKFDSDGQLDPGFGERGYVRPEVVGNGYRVPGFDAVYSYYGSEAHGLAVAPDGSITLGGGTGRWGEWFFARDIGMECIDCPQPLLARFDSDGELDRSFGQGGLLRLLEPTGGVIVGQVDQLQAEGNKTLVLGHAKRGDASVEVPFLARLNRDGSYDSSFGEDGLEFVEFPCTSSSSQILRESGCTTATRLRLKVGGLDSGRPWASVSIRPKAAWAQISSTTITLPPQLRLATTHLRPKMSLVVDGKPGKRRAIRIDWTGPRKPETFTLWGIGPADEVRFTLRRGSLSVSHRPPPRRIGFRFGVEYVHRDWGGWAGTQKLVRQAG